MKTKEKTIYFVVDNKYLQAILVPIYQLKHSNIPVIVYDCDSIGLDENIVEFIKQKFPFVSFEKIKDRWFDHLPAKGHRVHRVCLARLEAMQNSDSKLGLYLDGDVFFAGDVNKIFDYGLAPDEIIGGATDVLWISKDLKWKDWYDYIDDFAHNNINSGVCLFNPDLFRKHQIYDKCKKAMIEDNPALPDQDILNKVVQKKRILPWLFNGNIFYRNKFGVNNLQDKGIIVWHYVADHARPYKFLSGTARDNCPFYRQYTQIRTLVLEDFCRWIALKKQNQPTTCQNLKTSVIEISHPNWQGNNGKRKLTSFGNFCAKYRENFFEDCGEIVLSDENELHIKWSKWKHVTDCFSVATGKFIKTLNH